MPRLTAKQLKARDSLPFSIVIGTDRDGNEETIIVRYPDIRRMLLDGILPVPLLSDAVKMVGEWVGTNIQQADEDQRRKVMQTISEHGTKLIQFFDIWACASMVEPKAVMKQEDADPEHDVMWIGDLSTQTKERIFNGVTVHDPKAETRKAERASAATFPADGPSEGTASDVSELQPAAQ